MAIPAKGKKPMRYAAILYDFFTLIGYPIHKNG